MRRLKGGMIGKVHFGVIGVVTLAGAFVAFLMNDQEAGLLINLAIVAGFLSLAVYSSTLSK